MDEYKTAYDALGEEFQLAKMLIGVRTRTGLSQPQLARRIPQVGLTRYVVAGERENVVTPERGITTTLPDECTPQPMYAGVSVEAHRLRASPERLADRSL